MFSPFFLAVRYSTGPLSKCHHFDHEGGPDRNVRFGFHQIAPVFIGKDKVRNAKLTLCSALTFREIISDGKLELEGRKLTGSRCSSGTIDGSNDGLFDDNYKWLCQINNQHFFLPNMERMVPLSYLQSMSIQRQMDWDLVKSQQKVSIGKITYRGAVPTGSGRDIIALFSGLKFHI